MNNKDDKEEKTGVLWIIGGLMVIPLYFYSQWERVGTEGLIENIFYSILVILFFKYILGAK